MSTASYGSAVVALSLSVSGCYYPKKIEYYDYECNIQSRKLELTHDQMSSCGGSACLAALAVSAGSAIVSGSIVVAGNTMYWMEKQGKCVPKSSLSLAE